jgi:hypothetical protein
MTLWSQKLHVRIRHTFRQASKDVIFVLALHPSVLSHSRLILNTQYHEINQPPQPEYLREHVWRYDEGGAL